MRKVSKKKKPGTTALARRPARLPVRVPPKVEVINQLPAAAPLEASRNLLTDDIALGDLGLAELKFTPEEDAVLNRPVSPADIRIKPSGQPYLSHPTYTRWFNEAFGRTGWTLVPASKPLRDGKSVVVPYVLHIHGKPVAYVIPNYVFHFEIPR